MVEYQKTISGEVSISGVGLHTGQETTITFKPAEPDTGAGTLRSDDCRLDERYTVIESSWLWFDVWSADCPRIEYPRPDGVVSFDRL